MRFPESYEENKNKFPYYRKPIKFLGNGANEVREKSLSIEGISIKKYIMRKISSLRVLADCSKDVGIDEFSEEFIEDCEIAGKEYLDCRVKIVALDRKRYVNTMTGEIKYYEIIR